MPSLYCNQPHTTKRQRIAFSIAIAFSGGVLTAHAEDAPMKSNVEYVADKTKEAVVHGAERAKDAVVYGAGKTKDALSTAAEKTDHALHTAADKTAGALHTAGDKIEEKMGKKSE